MQGFQQGGWPAQQGAMPIPPQPQAPPVAPAIAWPAGAGEPKPPGEFIGFGDIKFSPSIGHLALALSKVQGAIAKKDRTGQVGKSKTRYADLEAVWDAIQQPLEKNEVAVPQFLWSDGQLAKVYTIVMHSSNEWIAGVLGMRPTEFTPQGMGSCFTYARRYALCAAVGVAPGDDDDGKAASASTAAVPGFGMPFGMQAGAPAAQQPQAPPAQQQPQKIQTPPGWPAPGTVLPLGQGTVGPIMTPEMHRRIERTYNLAPLVTGAGFDAQVFLQVLWTSYGTQDVAALTEPQYQELCERLRVRAR